MQSYATTTGTLKDCTPPPFVPTIASRTADLEALSTAHQNAGVYVTPSGATSPHLFATDDASQGKILTAFTAAKEGMWVDGSVWKCADGTFVAMTAADVITLAQTAQVYIQKCYANEAVLQQALQTDLNTDLTVGWPSNK